MATSNPKKIQSRKFLVKTDNIRIDQYLADCNKDLSRGVLQRLIKNGAVSVNGQMETKPSTRISFGDSIILTYEPPRLLAREDMVLSVIYKDDDVIVIDKPAGVVVHPTPSQEKPSIAAVLLATEDVRPGVGEDEFRPGIVHRLDVDTSGLLVVARTAEAYEYLKQIFQTRNIEKYYLSLVHGFFPEKHGKYTQPIGRVAGNKRLEAGIGRQAVTEYWVESRYRSKVDNFSLVRILLHTGRTHQIRVHFSSDGHPVAGDRLYGGKYRKSDKELFPRQFLHACRLKLRLPSGVEKEFSSPLPQDLKNSLGILTKL